MVFTVNNHPVLREGYSGILMYGDAPVVLAVGEPVMVMGERSFPNMQDRTSIGSIFRARSSIIRFDLEESARLVLMASLEVMKTRFSTVNQIAHWHSKRLFGCGFKSPARLVVAITPALGQFIGERFHFLTELRI